MVAERSRPLAASPFLLVLLSVAACNVLNGAGDLNIGPGLGEGTLADGGRIGDGASGGGEGGGGGDGGGTTGDDGGFISDAGINPKLKSCGMNQVCLPNADGWTPALFGLAGGPGGACPADYPQQNKLKTSGGGNCNCNCTPSSGSCAGSVDSRSDLACGGALTNLPVQSGACTPLVATLPLPVAFTARPNGPAPASCGGTVAPQLRGPQPATFCTGAVPAAGGSCTDPGEICVKQAGILTGSLTCIVHDGDIACPNRLSFRTLVGTAITDGRSCGTSCSCKAEACGGTLEAFSDPACATAVRTVNVDGTCTMAGADMSGASYRYTPSLGCGVSVPANVLGSETVTAPRTLCCSIGF